MPLLAPSPILLYRLSPLTCNALPVRHSLHHCTRTMCALLLLEEGAWRTARGFAPSCTRCHGARQLPTISTHSSGAAGYHWCGVAGGGGRVYSATIAPVDRLLYPRDIWEGGQTVADRFTREHILDMNTTQTSCLSLSLLKYMVEGYVKVNAATMAGASIIWYGGGRIRNS